MTNRTRSLETFDPTPEEAAAAERAKPTRAPLCLRCKAGPALPLVETASANLVAAFAAHAAALRGDVGRLRRADVEALHGAHAHLVRAARGRYCARCFATVIEYAQTTLRKVGT